MQNKKKIFSINEIEKLNINEIKELYSSYINPYQTKIFSNFSFGKEVFVKAKGMNIYTTILSRDFFCFESFLTIILFFNFDK